MPESNPINDETNAGTGRTRLARCLPWIKPLATMGPDLLRALRFRLSPGERRSRIAAYRACTTGEEFFSFAQQVLGTGQLAEEILPFLEFVAEQAPEKACEIGTADGGTTFLIGQCLPTCRLLIGADLYVKNRHLLRTFRRPELTHRFVSGSSRSQRVRRRVRGAIGEGELDLLFIDGDHGYEGVEHDFLTYGPLVRRDGIIAFHDICGGTGAAAAGGARAWVGGVPRFWKRVKPLYANREFVRDAAQHGFGIGAIRYDPEVVV